MPCGSCKYFDETETWGSKGYCTYYKRYYYPEEKACSHYSSGNSGCFLTTACCQYYGLADNCDELEAMRTLRDKYMMLSESGKALINEYYETAPEIERKISSAPDHGEICENIYQTVLLCKNYVEKNDFESAEELYKNMFFRLKNQFC